MKNSRIIIIIIIIIKIMMIIIIITLCFRCNLPLQVCLDNPQYIAEVGCSGTTHSTSVMSLRYSP